MEEMYRDMQKRLEMVIKYFCSIVPDNETTKEQVELLELAEIEPLSAVEGNDMEVLSPDAISHIIQASDGILSM